MSPTLAANPWLITTKIKKIFDEGKFTQEDVAKGLGLTQPHVSRLLLGKTPWRKKYIDKFAELYHKCIREILYDPSFIPVIANVCGEEDFAYRIVDCAEVTEMAPAPTGMESLEGAYCIKVEGNCFKPLLVTGNLVYARRGDFQEIPDNSLVIYVDEKGRGCLKRVKFSDDYIILKSLVPSGTDIIKPKSYLGMLDKVLWIKL